MNLEDQIKKFNLDFDLNKINEETKAQAETPKAKAETPVTEELKAELWELKTQINNLALYNAELEKINERKPQKTENTRQNEYNRKKNNHKSVACTTIAIILSILLVASYIVVCIYDAKRGWDIFYPAGEAFTLTYLFKVLAIGIFGGAIAVLIIIFLGAGLDILIDNIRLGAYDKLHSAELKEAKKADEQARKQAQTDFEEKQARDKKEYTEKIEKANAFISASTLVPDEYKTITNINNLITMVSLAEKSGKSFEHTIEIFGSALLAEQQLNLYYYTVFPPLVPYTLDSAKASCKKALALILKKRNLFTQAQQNDFFVSKDSPLVATFALFSIGWGDAVIERWKEVKTKKQATAFYNDTLQTFKFLKGLLDTMKNKADR